MKKRKWELPGIQDLTKDQEAAIESPFQGQHLIIGGPGTGKTVVVAMRARKHQHISGSDYIFLVYNRMLEEATKQMMADEDFKSCTYLYWFFNQYEARMGVEDEDGNREKARTPKQGRSTPDWSECERRVSDAADLAGFNGPKFLLIDEGQDMPPEFYRILIKFGYENFFIAADQNQQITSENSSRKDIEDCMAVDTKDVIELKHNFRNNYGIARLAQAFYTGDPASPPPNIPKRSRQLHTPKLYVFDRNSPEIYRRIAEAIVTFSKRDPQKLIGVLAPNHKVQDRYIRALRNVAGYAVSISEYKHNYSREKVHKVRFDQGGIIVLCAQSCKGLEFDTVILVDVDKHIIFRDHQDETKKLFYVMVSRARDKVFLLMNRNSDSQIQDILPSDQTILFRKNID